MTLVQWFTDKVVPLEILNRLLNQDEKTLFVAAGTMAWTTQATSFSMSAVLKYMNSSRAVTLGFRSTKFRQSESINAGEAGGELVIGHSNCPLWVYAQK